MCCKEEILDIFYPSCVHLLNTTQKLFLIPNSVLFSKMLQFPSGVPINAAIYRFITEPRSLLWVISLFCQHRTQLHSFY